jgi:hypothetical protein
MKVQIPTKLISFNKTQYNNLYYGKRDDCLDLNIKNAPIPGTRGFCEYLAGKHYQTLGYSYIHQVSPFGGNRPGSTKKQNK